ncbi:hypothetical protein CKO35_06670 [Ectothiorhodospira shaposhnikovii]|uniref:histidine phosphatase family protein n=1 Tax=Ectothiorhodospira shaposhnikovii TaxID=1054 RepID=UPI0019089254|nr:histidine phosphatase family protein [Ectothiorhodospira shaposhnikovii]MBK1672993.1 hypothetical protein [Ectothiorhodospira shaposhnikovii]
MTHDHWQIPPSVLRNLERIPKDRPVALLLRHSVRDHLPPSDADTLPITAIGRELALDLGACLQGRLQSLHASPLVRCMQTAEALSEGARAGITVIPDRHLGDPGVFVVDGRRAWSNWEKLGHEGVVRHLVSEPSALPGMARPDEAARFLVQHMLGAATGRPGIHVFVTHDSLVSATAGRILRQPVDLDCWPWYLEGAFFWAEEQVIHAAYRDHEIQCSTPLCNFNEGDVIEFARREIGSTVGLDTGARFFLAGGAFKSLLTGRPPRDLDLWAPSERDRQILIDALLARGARYEDPRPFADAFELSGRLIEIPHKVEPTTLPERLSLFDIGLSAVGVEHLGRDQWSAVVHPLATESVSLREVRLLKPLVNWKYALTTLERARRYACELSFSVPAEEEEVIWGLFEAQSSEMQTGMVDRYHRTAIGGYGVIEELASRYS